MSVLEAESDSSKENQNPMLHKDVIFRNDAIIDAEIEKIEMEMSRLFTRMESLKLEKQKISERRKQSTNSKQGFLQKIQDLKSQHQQQRRGVSLCPSEIYSATKSGQGASEGDVSNAETVNAKQSSRRQSCFWKLGDIDELKVTKVRGSGNGAPPRKAALIIDDAMKKTKAVTKKKDDVVSSSVQPKRLFRDTERSLASKKHPIQSSRAVASRYNHNSQSSSSVDGVGKIRSLSMGGTESSGRVKKRWEIPAKGEVVVYKSIDRESTPVIDEIAVDVLPKIRTLRCVAK